jgi:Protein of unknown function (DUF2752)
VLAAGAVLVASFNPAAEGSRFPACAFHASTGLWCPGCGLTRGTHQLLRGDIAGALSHNVFTPIVMLAIVGLWWHWLRTSWGRPSGFGALRVPMSLRWALPVAIIAYGLLRNIPAEPFTALAP